MKRNCTYHHMEPGFSHFIRRDLWSGRGLVHDRTLAFDRQIYNFISHSSITPRRPLRQRQRARGRRSDIHCHQIGDMRVGVDVIYVTSHVAFISFFQCSTMLLLLSHNFSYWSMRARTFFPPRLSVCLCVSESLLSPISNTFISSFKFQVPAAVPDTNNKTLYQFHFSFVFCSFFFLFFFGETFIFSIPDQQIDVCNGVPKRCENDGGIILLFFLSF